MRVKRIVRMQYLLVFDKHSDQEIAHHRVSGSERVTSGQKRMSAILSPTVF
jgi:hypothetical protein